MFSLGSSHRFYLYDGHFDMRKSFDGLFGLVITVMGRQPTSGEVFVFLNRNRTHIKLLHWEHGGFVLYYKRLERGTFLFHHADDVPLFGTWERVLCCWNDGGFTRLTQAGKSWKRTNI